MTKTMTPNEMEVALEVLDLEEQRRMCCEPYDCMHHELCGEEQGYCYRCERMIILLAQVRHLTADDWKLAEAAKDKNEADLNAYRLETARELESIGDYLGADRVLGLGEEDEW